MKLWEVHDVHGATICVEPAKDLADEAVKAYPGAKVRPLYVTPTKEGIAKLLTDFAGGAG